MAADDSTRSICVIPGCEKRASTRGMCPMHYQRWRIHGDPLKLMRPVLRADGEGGYTAAGYLLHQEKERRVYDHVRRAELALGKRLPHKAHVHHVDYNRSHNENANLVICPNQKYHQLLHIRTDALDACGNANWRKCALCKRYDDTANMRQSSKGETFVHGSCQSDRMARYHREHPRDRRRVAPA